MQQPLNSFIFLRWIALSLAIGFIVGNIGAFFLSSLQLVTDFRDSHRSLIWGLPFAGFCIGYCYHRWGGTAVGGNNLLLEEYRDPQAIIPWKMAPLILFSTLVTHLFGGSAGREGTAVQIGGSIADQFTKVFHLAIADRRICLIAGIAAGFSAVFGTPAAAAIFALEVLWVGKNWYKALIPSFLSAYMAIYSCNLWDVAHTHYHIPELIPSFSASSMAYSLLAGIAFGLTACLFARSQSFFSSLFTRWISYPPFRPLVGGLILATIILYFGIYKYIGLGIPTIVASFSVAMESYDFLLMLLFTTFTLAAGFKGGEVTPLFFVGATLGNILFGWIPLPMGLLAAMGFVAVFAGATHTPLACTIMGVELFGLPSVLYIAVACFTAYICSGNLGIYSSQKIGTPKRQLYEFLGITKKAV
ncbi:voltage-gated chloride channel family protein [Sphingobacteriaceae bacterium WQ 2009]|uniref:Voltage-gated chloride channel family protein n=1 Tax=Rhinopithecimicrobium faecis TaxID=2820698 RepID=A0A8T4HBN5_9SPHI|nr:voltage-gated chloride channel family protein [Sphingobacteriaceae bacterium WQ 2009]